VVKFNERLECGKGSERVVKIPEQLEGNELQKSQNYELIVLPHLRVE
jgi:hypothetical protein